MRPHDGGALVLVPWLDVGGADQVALDMITGLDAAGIPVEVMTTQSSPDRRIGSVPPDVAVWRLPALLPNGAIPGAIIERARATKPAVVHVLNSRIGLDAAAALSRMDHKPAVVCHLLGEEGPGGGYPPYAVRVHGADITAFITVSDDLAGIAAKYGAEPSRIHVVRPPVDLKRYHPAVPRAPDRGVLRVLLPARLADEKRPLLAIAAVEELIDRGMPASLTLTGDGPLRREVEAAISASRYPDAFCAPGVIDDMPSAYRAHDVVMLTSRFEASPLALGEAMACGLAVVAPRVGGIPELVGGAGVLVAEPSRATLAEALATFTSESARRRAGQEGRARAEALLGPESTTSRLIEIHRRAAAGALE